MTVEEAKYQGVSEAAGKAGEIRGFAQRHERRELGVELGGEPSLDAAQDLLALDGTEMLIGQRLDLRLERPVAALEPRDLR